MKVAHHELAQDECVIPPKDGWKAHTLYLVHVSFSKTNPVHEAYLQVGFLRDVDAELKQINKLLKRNVAYRTVGIVPGGYSEIWNNNYDKAIKFADAWYLEVIKELHTQWKP